MASSIDSEIVNQLSKMHLNNHSEEYESGQLINEGSFAKIITVRSRISKKEFALKIVFTEDISEKQFNQFKGELLMLRQLEHPNIIKPETSWTEGSQLAIVLPLMPFRSCADVARKLFPTGISEYSMGQILTHILAAVEYLHDKKIIHRCIKGSHILIDQNGVAVLSGLKFAVSFAEGCEYQDKTDLADMTKCLNWLSPEMMAQDSAGYSYNTDVYSLGITILELCNGIVPFAEMSAAAMLVQKIKFPSPKLWDIKNLPSKENVPDEQSSSKEGCQSVFYDEKQDEDMIDTHEQASVRDEVYSRKCYSKEFQSFTDICLANEKARRASVAQLKKHKFMKGFFNLGPNNLIRSLRLNEAIQFHPSSSGDHADQLKPSNSDANSNFDWSFD